MKRIITAIFCVLIAVMLIVGIRAVNRPPLMQKAETATVEDSISSRGFIVRDERVFYATATGTVYFGAAEGERVSRDTLVSKIYSGTVGEDILAKLSTIDKKISRAITEENKSALYSSDSMSAESGIKAKIESIYDYARNMDAARAAECRESINNLRSGTDERTNTLTDLKNQKYELETRIGINARDIYTDTSGVFSTYLDGLESVLEPDRISQYTPSYIKGLEANGQKKTETASVGVGDPICKVVNNHVWYTLSVIDAADVDECGEGQTVTLRFRNMADAEVKGVIEYISAPDESGDVLVLIRCSTYLESAYSYRTADMDIIFKSYTGYKVPIYAVRTKEEGGYTVIAEAGISRFNCDVDILYTDAAAGYAIIESSENAVNKLSKAERIIISEPSY